MLFFGILTHQYTIVLFKIAYYVVEIAESVKAAARLPQSVLLPEFLICPNYNGHYFLTSIGKIVYNKRIQWVFFRMYCQLSPEVIYTSDKVHVVCTYFRDKFNLVLFIPFSPKSKSDLYWYLDSLLPQFLQNPMSKLLV